MILVPNAEILAPSDDNYAHTRFYRIRANVRGTHPSASVFNFVYCGNLFYFPLYPTRTTADYDSDASMLIGEIIRAHTK